jgi:hypothetical protein
LQLASGAKIDILSLPALAHIANMAAAWSCRSRIKFGFILKWSILENSLMV